MPYGNYGQYRGAGYQRRDVQQPEYGMIGQEVKEEDIPAYQGQDGGGGGSEQPSPLDKYKRKKKFNQRGYVRGQSRTVDAGSGGAPANTTEGSSSRSYIA
jgi:hypothetical protein